MHIVLAFLGAVVTMLVLLHRLAQLGIDLGGLNPFLWRRRRAWRQKYEANPIFSLEDPKEIAALLLVGIAKIDGDVSAEEKRALLSEFETTFSLDAREASELMTSTVYLLGDVQILKTQLDDVLGTSKGRFSPAQSESVLAMMDRIAAVGGPPSQQQKELIERTREHFRPAEAPQGAWG